MPKTKEQERKHEEEEEDICDILFQCFWRKSSNLLYFQIPYLSHFFIHFKLSKNRWLRIYKTFLLSKCNEWTIIKLFQHSKLWCFVSNVLKKNYKVHYSCIIITHCSFFCCWNKVCSLPFNISNATKNTQFG
jgi:hypothetical protein